jgi:hypothetical protein
MIASAGNTQLVEKFRHADIADLLERRQAALPKAQAM